MPLAESGQVCANCA